jgi:Flp pilus assembly pilin Flp
VGAGEAATVQARESGATRTAVVSPSPHDRGVRRVGRFFRSTSGNLPLASSFEQARVNEPRGSWVNRAKASPNAEEAFMPGMNNARSIVGGGGAIRRFMRDDRGTETMEWGLVCGLIIIGAVAAIVLIGPKVTDMWNDVNNEIPPKE